MRTIEHTIDIAAPTSEVWDVLTATSEYRDWNIFMPRLDGHVVVGERLSVTIDTGRRSMTFKPTVIAAEPGRLIRWRGHLGIRAILDGEHEFRLESNPEGGTRFTQRETFTGVVVPFMRRTLDDTETGFVAMNQALHDRTLARTLR
jgi:hypothetical protein